MADIIIIMTQILGPSSLDICIWISPNRFCCLRQTSTNCLDRNCHYYNGYNNNNINMLISHTIIYATSSATLTTTLLVYGLDTYAQNHLLHLFWRLFLHLNPTLLSNLLRLAMDKSMFLRCFGCCRCHRPFSRIVAHTT